MGATAECFPCQEAHFVRWSLWDDLRSARWSLRQESNLYLPLRRRPFYPLDYGGKATRIFACAWRAAFRLLPAPRPDQVQRIVQPRLRTQREALRDAVDQLPVAGGRVEPALVADVPAPRQLLAERDHGFA